MTTAESAAIESASALAVALRVRVAVLFDDPRTDDTWGQIAEDALAGIATLAAALPAVAAVSHWTDREAGDSGVLPAVWAIAAVRSLEVRVRRARGQGVISVRRGGW